MVHRNGGDHTSSQLWNVTGPCAYGGAPLIGGRGMATDGCILKAAKPRSACLPASRRAGMASNSQASDGSTAVLPVFPTGDSVCNSRSSQSPVRRLWKNRPPHKTVDQASLLYLSLTRCCAAQHSVPMGRVAPPLDLFFCPASWRSRGDGFPSVMSHDQDSNSLWIALFSIAATTEICARLCTSQARAGTCRSSIQSLSPALFLPGDTKPRLPLFSKGELSTDLYCPPVGSNHEASTGPCRRSMAT